MLEKHIKPEKYRNIEAEFGPLNAIKQLRRDIACPSSDINFKVVVSVNHCRSTKSDLLVAEMKGFSLAILGHGTGARANGVGTTVDEAIASLLDCLLSPHEKIPQDWGYDLSKACLAVGHPANPEYFVRVSQS